jgi:uncharacterized protein (TIGR02246 family)
MLKNGTLLLALAVLFSACSQAPAIDLQAEKEQIRQLNQQWYAAENRKDLDAIMQQFLAEECILQVPGIEPLEGHEAIRTFMEVFFQSLVSVSGEPTQIVVSASGDLAYDWGATHAVLEGPEGRVDDEQKYLIVWQKVDGEWKAVAGSFSSNLPLS